MALSPDKYYGHYLLDINGLKHRGTLIKRVFSLKIPLITMSAIVLKLFDIRNLLDTQQLQRIPKSFWLYLSILTILEIKTENFKKVY